MPIPRQFMDNQCEVLVKISCEVAFLTGMVEQLQKENEELKKKGTEEIRTNGPKRKESVVVDNA